MGPQGNDEPFALSGLDALLTTAAANSPGHILLEDDAGAVAAADLMRRTRRLASLLRSGGLERGERVLIVAGAQTASVVALVATLRAGLEPVVVSPSAGVLELVSFINLSGAVAVIGPSHYGAQEFGEIYLSAAAVAESIRAVLTHGPDQVDGAADVSAAALDAMNDPADLVEADALEMPTITTVAGPASAPVLVSHRQAALFADALSLVEQARINPSKRIISLIPPSTLAGLVCGPCAAFVGASRLVLHGPFASRRFLAHCDAEPGYHLVVPAALGATFAQPELAADLSSLILVSRFADADAFALPEAIAAERPIVDVYSFGEESLLAQQRHDGMAEPPVRPADSRLTDGLGARLNRARAEHRLQGADLPR